MIKSVQSRRLASNVEEFSSERKPKSHKPTVSSIQGKMRIRLNAEETWYESALEKDFLSLCASENRVQKISAQPFTLHFEDMLMGKPRRYTPDFLLETDSRLNKTWPIRLPSRVLVEVKPFAKLYSNRRKLLPKFHAARLWCDKNNAHFMVFTDKTISDLELRTARMLERGLLTFPIKKTEADLLDLLNTYGGLHLGGLLEMLQDKGNDKRSCTDTVMRWISMGEIWATLGEGLKPDTILRYIHEPV